MSSNLKKTIGPVTWPIENPRRNPCCYDRLKEEDATKRVAVLRGFGVIKRFGFGLAYFADQCQTLGQIEVNRSGGVFVGLQTVAGARIVFALAHSQANFHSVCQFVSGLYEGVCAFHVALVAIGQDADACTVLVVSDQAEIAEVDRAANFHRVHAETVSCAQDAMVK